MCGDESCWDQHGSVVDLSGHDRVVGVLQCGRQSGRGGEVCGAAPTLQVGVDCGYLLLVQLQDGGLGREGFGQKALI